MFDGHVAELALESMSSHLEVDGAMDGEDYFNFSQDTLSSLFSIPFLVRHTATVQQFLYCCVLRQRGLERSDIGRIVWN